MQSTQSIVGQPLGLGQSEAQEAVQSRARGRKLQGQPTVNYVGQRSFAEGMYGHHPAPRTMSIVHTVLDWGPGTADPPSTWGKWFCQAASEGHQDEACARVLAKGFG